MAFDWSELPDINEVRSALKGHAEIKARLRVAELELDIYKAGMSRLKPRDATVKLIGLDEQSRVDLEKLRQRVNELQAELDNLEADIKFNEYRKEAAKIMSYKGKI